MTELNLLPLSRIGYVCGANIHWFGDLWNALDSVDIEVLAGEMSGKRS